MLKLQHVYFIMGFHVQMPTVGY